MAFVLLLLIVIARTSTENRLLRQYGAVRSIRSEDVRSSTANDNDNQKSCSCSTSANTVTIFHGESPNLLTHQFNTQNVLMPGMMCTCRSMSHIRSGHRDDYRYTTGIGAHKLHTKPATWNEARKTCNEESGHLAIINSLTETQILLDIFNQTELSKDLQFPLTIQAWLSVNTDLYQEGEWVTILGDLIAKAGYSKWTNMWSGQPDNRGRKNAAQNCGSLVKDSGMDDIECELSFLFFCELLRLQLLQ